MSHMHFRVNLHSIVAWMSRNSLLKACPKSEVQVTATELCKCKMHHTGKYSQYSSIIWPVWLNGWVFAYELSEIFIFVYPSLRNSRESKFSPLVILQNYVLPLFGNSGSRAKTHGNSTWVFLEHPPGNSNSFLFLIEAWIFHKLFLQYPSIFHVLNPPSPPYPDIAS